MPLPIAPTSARCQRCPRNPVMLHFCSGAGLGWPRVPSGARAHPRRARSCFSLQRAFFQPRSQPAPRGPRHGVGCGQARPCRNPSVALQTSPGAGARLPHAKPNRAGISSGFVLSLAGKKKKKIHQTNLSCTLASRCRVRARGGGEEVRAQPWAACAEMRHPGTGWFNRLGWLSSAPLHPDTPRSPLSLLLSTTPLPLCQLTCWCILKPHLNYKSH